MGEPDIKDILLAMGPVEGLELDDALGEHLQERGTYDKHRVSLSEILEVYLIMPKLFLNPSTTGRAPVVMLGNL